MYVEVRSTVERNASPRRLGLLRLWNAGQILCSLFRVVKRLQVVVVFSIGVFTPHHAFSIVLYCGLDLSPVVLFHFLASHATVSKSTTILCLCTNGWRRIPSSPFLPARYTRLSFSVDSTWWKIHSLGSGVIQWQLGICFWASSPGLECFVPCLSCCTIFPPWLWGITSVSILGPRMAPDRLVSGCNFLFSARFRKYSQLVRLSCIMHPSKKTPNAELMDCSPSLTAS